MMMPPLRPTLRSLTLASGLMPTPNRRICGSLSLAQMPQSGTSHIPETLSEITIDGRKEVIK